MCEARTLVDRTHGGRKVRMLNVVDDFMRECLPPIANTSLSGARVARELDAVVTWSGKPHSIARDNETEFTSTAMLRWQLESGVEWH